MTEDPGEYTVEKKYICPKCKKYGEKDEKCPDCEHHYFVDEDMVQKKKYFFNIIEEYVLNPDYYGYRGGRVEVFDRDDDSGYAMAEYRLFMPAEFWDKFCDVFDFEESDLPVEIVWDMEIVKTNNKEGEK